MKQTLDLRDDGNRRRRVDSQDAGQELRDAPWPVRALAIIGGMTCIACFLVWFLAGRVTIALDKIDSNTAPMVEHVKTAEKLSVTLEAIERDHRDSNGRIERYMRLMCLNGARTAADRNLCMGVDR